MFLDENMFVNLTGIRPHGEATFMPPREHTCKTAEEFWSVLDPKYRLLNASGPLLYRGQADSTWKLCPSIFRHGNSGINQSTPSDDLVRIEALYLLSFMDHCDSIGLPLPGDSFLIREQHLNFSARLGIAGAAINTTLWPPQELFTYLALAQHHGLPTRLLDWSTRSYVAAFFAAMDVCRTAIPDTLSDQCLAVWVLCSDGSGGGLMPGLEIVRVPGSHNRNVAAQAGDLTLLRQKGVRGQPFQDTLFLDDYMTNKNWSEQRLVKVTLPVYEAPEVLNLCKLHGITNSSLFPDYYGAARAALDDMKIHSYPEGWSRPRRWPQPLNNNDK